MTEMMIGTVIATTTMMIVGGGIDAEGRASNGATITAAMSASSTAIGSVAGKRSKKIWEQDKPLANAGGFLVCLPVLTKAMQEEHFFQCPYCWQEISMVLDLSVERQTYVEDCEVCCRPIEISYTADEGELVSFEANQLE
jgi:hypothetical protein